MPLFSRNIISSQVIKAKSDKLQKRALRDARKKIRQGELTDSHALALYLTTIDSRYTHVETDITNATRVANYARVRAERIAETGQMLGFISQDYDELNRLHQIVSNKAAKANRLDDWKQDPPLSIDVTKLKASFDRLTRDEK